MTGKISALIMAIVMVTFFVSCGSKEPPKCSDEETFSLVQKIILEQIGGSEGLTEKEIKENMKIEYPRASEFNEKIKRYTCEAKLNAGGMYELPITYKSQLDDNNRHIVVVNGISYIDLVSVKTGIEESIKKSRAATSVKPTETPTASKVPEKTAAGAPSDSDTKQTAATASISEQAKLTPSFDCAKASTFAEKTICSDKLLGQLDGALAQNYRYMLASDIGDGARNDLKITQKKWLELRNKCQNNRCIADTYRKRIDEVCDYPVISGVHPICISSDEVK
jgi:uncharacterized protein YecT (DUF1311 family)